MCSARSPSLSAGISTAGFGFLVSPAESTPEYLSRVQLQVQDERVASSTPAGPATARRLAARENLNPYGTDFGAANHDFGAIEAKDSDGDGFSNLDEIKAGTFPGDTNENPDKKAEPPPKPAPTTTTTRPFPFNLLPENLL